MSTLFLARPDFADLEAGTNQTSPYNSSPPSWRSTERTTLKSQTLTPGSANVSTSSAKVAASIWLRARAMRSASPLARPGRFSRTCEQPSSGVFRSRRSVDAADVPKLSQRLGYTMQHARQYHTRQQAWGFEKATLCHMVCTWPKRPHRTKQSLAVVATTPQALSSEHRRLMKWSRAPHVFGTHQFTHSRLSRTSRTVSIVMDHQLVSTLLSPRTERLAKGSRKQWLEYASRLLLSWAGRR